jgi:phage shock protein E
MMTREEFCDELNRIIAEGGQLVDVRSCEEFAGGALEGACNVPLHVLPVKHEELSRDKPVLLYCVSGARSRQAAYFLSQRGFNEVYDLGGISQLSGCRPPLQ